MSCSEDAEAAAAAGFGRPGGEADLELEFRETRVMLDEL